MAQETPASESRASALSDDLLPLLQRQDRAERLAAADLLAQPVLALVHLDAAVRDLLRLLLRHHDDAHVVGDDPVAAAHALPAAAHLGADLSVALRVAGVGHDPARPGGEAHGADVVDVADGAVDDDAGEALGEAGVAGELAPHRRL